MTISFWLNNPTILLNKEYITEVWPTPKMSYDQKLNAISRLIILTTLLGYLVTQNMRLLVVGIITLIIIIVIANINNKPKLTKEMLKEGFTKDINNSNDIIVNPVTLESVLKSEFKEGTKKNPFSNVLLTEIGDTPQRLKSPPAFSPQVEETITKNIKKSVQFNNPGIKNTDKQLFGDLYENWELDQNARSYYSTANTEVQPGDTLALGKWLYGGMPSSKESNTAGNLQREKDAYRYTLY